MNELEPADYSAADLAELFGVSASTINRWCRSGDLSYVEVGPKKVRRFTKSHVAEMASTVVAEADGDYESKPMPTIGDILASIKETNDSIQQVMAKLNERMDLEDAAAGHERIQR